MSREMVCSCGFMWDESQSSGRHFCGSDEFRKVEPKMNKILEEKLKNREQLILQQNKQLSLQKEVIEKLVKTLKCEPSSNGYREAIAEALAFAKEKLSD